ncbi:MAG: MepB family protein [Flavobacteriales bacterium]|nr:MepB family protein [Flavobacteriales bacterium]
MNELDPKLNIIKTRVYDTCDFILSDYSPEKESIEYDACQYTLNGNFVLGRSAKITPKKVGQFVTCWKRNNEGITEPYHATDSIDFYIITVESNQRLGQFVFPKSVLISKGIISTDKKEGKRGFRVYPPWDTVESKQAQKTQKWQVEYFYEISDSMEMERIKQLFLLN